MIPQEINRQHFFRSKIVIVRRGAMVVVTMEKIGVVVVTDLKRIVIETTGAYAGARVCGICGMPKIAMKKMMTSVWAKYLVNAPACAATLTMKAG